jgi:hypothetical protein
MEKEISILETLSSNPNRNIIEFIEYRRSTTHIFLVQEV